MPTSRGYRTSTRRSLSTQVLLLQAYRWVSIVVRFLPHQKRRVSLSSPQSRAKNLPERILPHRPTVTSDSHSHFGRFPPLPLPLSPVILAFHLTTHQLYFVLSSFTVIQLYCFQVIPGLGVVKGGCVPVTLGWNLVYK
jgi:hypothetical protein